MSIDILIVFGLILLSLVLFAWERFSFDLTALLILGILLLTGIVTPGEGLSGFSNPATVTIAAMFVLTEGLRRTGFLDRIGDLLMEAGQGRFWRTLVILMVTVGFVSGFINNTATVALFIPVVITVAARMDVSPSKLLIPLSFASMFGGVSTLIGTSTNLLVSSIAQEAGVGAFGMFDFTPVGLAFFGTGLAYMLLIGVRLVPARRSVDDLTRSFGMGRYITDVEVVPGSPLEGRFLEESGFAEDLDVDVLEVLRRGGDEDRDLVELAVAPDVEEGGADARPTSAVETDLPHRPRGISVRIRVGDVLRVRGGAEEIEQLLDREGVEIRPTRKWVDADLELGRAELVEAVVAPDSSMVGRAVREVDFPDRFGAVVLALRKHGEVQREHLEEVALAGGDSLLLLMDPARITQVQEDESFVVVSGVGRRRRPGRMWVAVAVLAGVVLSAAVGLVPIVVSAVVGGVVMVLTGCLDMEQAYEAVNWKIIFLLAGILPLGTAMEKTGAAAFLADHLLRWLGELGPHAILAGFLFITMALTAIVTNNATAVLLAPVAISAAESLSVDPWPLLMGVTYAASLSFVTPVGYQTNTLVYGPGGYRFTDYTRVGALLNLLFLVLGTVLIPVVFPF